jgi:hypothetical protein
MSSPSASAVSARHGAILPVVVVALVIAIVVFGGYAVNGMLSSPTGPSVEVGGVVRVQPLSGWELVGRFEDPPGVRLTRGSGSLDVVAAPFSGSARDLVSPTGVGVVFNAWGPTGVLRYITEDARAMMNAAEVA